LTGDWVLVSPHRARRPWLGQVEKELAENLPSYDPDCYLCPGNSRAGGKQNPPYTSTYVFENDFPALLPQPGLQAQIDKASDLDFFCAELVSGICRVVCFSPRHDLTLPELSQENVEAVIQTWSDQTQDLGARDEIRYVQVFEIKER
jgi:UDPglucose--hexose-1-phosphate uridylyltransferase